MSVKIKYYDFVSNNKTVEQAEEIYQQRINDSYEVFDKFSSTFENRACPVCGSNDNKVENYFHNKYIVVRCLRCCLEYVNPAPSMKALEYYYNECKCNKLYGSLLRSRVNVKNIILSERVQHIILLIEELLKETDKVRVLEIGCSSGAFLSELYKALDHFGLVEKVELSGIDIDREAIHKAVTSYADLRCDSAEKFVKNRKNKFELILHFELIEHLIDPFALMSEIWEMLTTGGYCHFHTPNANGFDNLALTYNDFRPLAHSIFPPMHLQAFTTQNILHFALRASFKLKQMDTPGNFDVDIVKRFSPSSDSVFSHIDIFNNDQLAVIQQWLKVLSGSSHMRVTLVK